MKIFLHLLILLCISVPFYYYHKDICLSVILQKGSTKYWRWHKSKSILPICCGEIHYVFASWLIKSCSYFEINSTTCSLSNCLSKHTSLVCQKSYRAVEVIQQALAGLCFSVTGNRETLSCILGLTGQQWNQGGKSVRPIFQIFSILAISLESVSIGMVTSRLPFQS